eukprot:m.171803 g.171803  ORF g.171803 m.171803 type:complete len:217 (+) comp18282_c0_seq39:176-826(+)
MMSLRWGICGTGKIAHDFTAALNSLQFDVAFVGASSKEKAAEFAKLHNVLAHGTYVDLAESDSVDVVYIGTVHSAHKKHCLMMLNKNKAVLCEKPCTLNANDTKEVIAAARSNGVFFAEAMWTRYTPIVIEARKRLQRGDIGKIVMVQSDFGFRADTSNGGRLFDRALGDAYDTAVFRPRVSTAQAQHHCRLDRPLVWRKKRKISQTVYNHDSWLQ